MTLFEILRFAIIITGWPFLVIGSVYVLYKQTRFGRKVGKTILNEMMFNIVLGSIITMFGLGIVATILMYENLNIGVKVVLPIFLAWFSIMFFLMKTVNKFAVEVLRREYFYDKLMEGIENVTKGNYNFNIKADKNYSDRKNENIIMFNKMAAELREKQVFLEREKKRGEELNRIKSEFISIAAHQLRTPLASIKWVFSLLLQGDAGDVSGEQKDILEKGMFSTERMIGLVNDLLNSSRIEEGKFDYNFAEASTEEVLQKVIKIEESFIKEKNINFQFNKQTEKINNIRLDAQKIFLAFQNILENAINYTLKNGNINIYLKQDDKNVIIIFEDDGVGIPKSQYNKLFTKFFRGSNAIKLQTEGSGLGLFITKNIIERHNGKIELESEEGMGTKLTVYLPVN